jgi:hypothetical protein
MGLLPLPAVASTVAEAILTEKESFFALSSLKECS